MSSEPVNIDAVIAREVKTKNPDSQPGTERMEESSSTPPSSPPLVKQDAKKRVPSVTKKRSHEEMTTERDFGTESSATVIGDSEQMASQAGKEIDSSVVSSLSTPARSMPPPAKPSSNMTPPTQKPPRSGQGTVTPDVPSQLVVVEEAAHSQAKSEASTSVDDANPSEASDEPSSFEDPQDKIEDFSWTDLEQRYHNEMKQFEITEQQIMAEFDGLSQYFGVWAQSGCDREVDRSFKRLKTQMTLVKHHEDELEQKRLHYIKVVDAFKSALELLAK